MYLKSLRLQNLLSFGPDAEPITFGPLNVLIGPNGSGKSNLIEAIGLLEAAPRSLSDAIRDGGGVAEWLWKGSKDSQAAKLEAAIGPSAADSGVYAEMTHTLELGELGQRLEVYDESIKRPLQRIEEAFFAYIGGRPHIRLQGSMRALDSKEFKTIESVLSQRRDPAVYPELAVVESFYSEIAIYQDWLFGRFAPPRLPQPADLPNDRLLPDARNLGLILNLIRKHPEAKASLLKHLGVLYEGIRDVDVSVVGGTVQVFLHEHKWIIPATRLSDGTLRWLSLLAILLNPQAASLVCIEEPEMGLHPDLLPPLAQLLREASERMQLIVTTHSDVLVDALSDTPESVIVCEKHEGSTQMHRLDKGDLAEWLQKYSLGQLWRRGEIGGNRW
ncbi:AAA family ATPase [Hyalangium versicolor]|uniref:AAA family ATPase n=1 Tax=Hyalangium versicolor TaxID=2861190 RepID=UPI001CCA3B3E|nr:AAA family ATPase [Hyalangium versicolor]